MDYRRQYYQGTPGLAGGYSAEYQAVYDQFSSKPSDADAIAQNSFVTALVNGGIWSKLDRMFVLASHASGVDSLLDWVHPTGTAATLGNAPAWVQYEGYTGNGTTQYIDTNYNPTSHAINYASDDAMIGGYLRTLDGEQKTDIGSSITNLSRLYADGSRVERHYLNTNSYAFKTTPVATLGFRSDQRVTGSDYVNIYLNGVETVGGLDIAEGLPNATFALIADHSVSFNAFCARQLSLGFMGGAITAAQHTNFYNAFQALMTHYGTQV